MLQDLQLNVVQLSSVEKLLILATNNFSGLLKLNEDLDDIEGNLSDKNTIQSLIRVIKKADKDGFWL